jgi:WD40 repeat protein
MKTVEKIKEFTGHAGAIYCLAQGRKNTSVFSGSADGFIAEWDLQTLEPSKFSVKLEAPVFTLCHIVKLNLLVAGLFNGHIHVIDLNEKKEIKHFKVLSKGIYSLFYDDVKNRLYSGGGDGVFNVWDIETMQHMLSLPLCDGKIRDIVKGGSENEIFVCCGDGKLRILETEFFNEINSIETNEGGLNSVLVSYDKIITAGKDAHIKIFSKDSYTAMKSIPAHNFGIYKLVQWGNRNFVSCSLDKTIKVWNFTNLESPLRLDFKLFKGHTHSVNDLYVCEANNYLISCGDDKKIIVWKQI